MELHVHKTFHHGHLGEEKHQMLNLNRRLESYLSRVKLLEEENALLAKEIQALRRSGHGASARRKGLEEELRQVRLEVDEAWRDKLHTELEVGRLAEQLQALDLQRQREVQANAEAKMKLEKSRKELEEEQRAQMWLREKVGQLEREMMHIIQTHQEDVAHLEAAMTRSRAAAPPTSAQGGNQVPNLLHLGQEFSQRASRAWQEAAEAYQGQLARLEESLNQARSRLNQAAREKSESQLKLQALEKEIASAHDVRLHLEKTAAQQGHEHSREIQQLQEHLEELEAEKAELGQQMDHLIPENRRLLQLKTSLGLEVATYRALLDGESLRGDVSLLNQPRHISITDTVRSPLEVKKSYQTQLSATHKTTSLSSVRGMTGRGPTALTLTPIWTRKHVSLSQTPPRKDTTKSETQEAPYPKILQDGAVENFRPQEVQEKVTYAEPLSPPNEEEVLTETSGGKQGEEDWSNVGSECPEEAVGFQVESDLSTEPPFSDDVSLRGSTTPNLAPSRMTQQPDGFSVEADKDVSFEMPAERKDMQKPPAAVDAWVEKESKEKEAQYVQEETSDSETEAVLEPNLGSRTSSPISECETEESVLNADFSRDENILKEDVVEIRQEISSCMGTNETDAEYKLYPDGEEMDTWDSVIERKLDLKVDDGLKKDEEKLQHAEPEEDISAREQEHKKSEIRQEVAADIQQVDYVALSVVDTRADDDGKHVALEEEHVPPPENEDHDEEEDSQNVSVSWRTELESDSYAQDNTLADTRPLIRYKSDETDANTQASHMDESESSEGEQEKKIGETGSGTWSEAKSKRFGTMEDLCEDVEGEGLDGDYNLEYVHSEDSVDHDMAGNENVTVENDTESAEEMMREVVEVPSDEETEELFKPMVPVNVDHDEELETDRLVEQELENLATDSYVAHFAQRQVSERKEMLHLQGKSDEETMEQQEAGIAKTEDASSCAEPEVKEHLEELEAEKAELGQQMDHLIPENRRLLQLKTSLGLEVATYRALLDGESLRGDVSLLNQPRHISITDTVRSPLEVKKSYQTQLSATHKTTSLSSVRGMTGRGPTALTLTPIWTRKHVSLSQTPPRKDTTKSETQEAPYPKILQDGAVENFRPQEVQEKVTYAEPLSPPNEEEVLTETSGGKQGEEDWSNVGSECPEEAVGFQVESDLSTEPPFSDDVSLRGSTTPNLAPSRMTQQPDGFSVEADKDVSFEMPAERKDMQKPPAAVDAWVEKESKEKEAQYVQEETSDSETEAVLEPNLGSRTSSPISECETEESVLNADFSRDENILKEDVVEIRQEISSCMGTNETDAEYKLYPDGEEMDTWDSVIERKLDLKVDDGLKKDEEKLQHAEPEEDISAREQEHKKSEIRQEVAADIQQVDYVALSVVDTRADDDGKHVALEEEHVPPPENEDHDEEEDSQNVSVSWRTELESDSYAQDNTLADTRPLIRYKSDETDANTQASHMDESESSEGEQEKKIGETGSGTWSEAKSKRFGTMEDLCEDVEGEGLDGDYNLEYVHSEDSVDHDMAGNENVTVENDTESAEEMMREVVEVPSDEETEELFKPMVPVNVDHDEELETDRLVEQELENLATDSYVAHFAQRQVSERKEMLHLQGKSDEETMEQQEAGIAKTEDASSCAEPEVKVHHELLSSTVDELEENLCFTESSVVIPQAEHEDQEALDAPEKKEEQDEHNVSMVTHADATEDHSGFSDFIVRPDMEEISEEPNSDQDNLKDAALSTEEKEVVAWESSEVSRERLTEDVADCQEVSETAEWEVLSGDVRDQDEDYEECGNVPAKSYPQDDGGSDEGVKEEPLEITPDRVPEENDIFAVKDSTDSSPHGFFGVKSDFWVSSLETGATNHPDEACNDAAEQTNQNLGFADGLVWGNLENPNVVNSSGLDNDSFKPPSAKKEQLMRSEVKQAFCRNVAEGDLVHSEESDAEGESWSSGEEPV